MNRGDFKTAIDNLWAHFRPGSLPTPNDLLAWYSALGHFDGAIIMAAIARCYSDTNLHTLPNAQHVLRVCESIAKCHAYKAPKVDPNHPCLPAPPVEKKPEEPSRAVLNMIRKFEELREHQRIAGITGRLVGSQILRMYAEESAKTEIVTADEYKPRR